nr:MAG TPA: hypothetical protein [Caudoviricetes sp.]
MSIRYLFLSGAFILHRPLTLCIIAQVAQLVNTFFKIFRKFFLHLSSALSAFPNRPNRLYYNQ